MHILLDIIHICFMYVLMNCFQRAGLRAGNRSAVSEDDVQCGRRTGMAMLPNFQNRWERTAWQRGVPSLAGLHACVASSYGMFICICV